MIFLKNNQKSKRDVFNIGPSDSGVYVRDIAKIACEIAGDDKTTIHFEDKDRGWIGDVPKFKYDTAKAKRAGWIPNFNSQEAVKKAIKEIKMQITDW